MGTIYGDKYMKFAATDTLQCVLPARPARTRTAACTAVTIVIDNRDRAVIDNVNHCSMRSSASRIALKRRRYNSTHAAL